MAFPVKMLKETGITLKVEGKNLIITCPMAKPTLSGGGNMNVVSSKGMRLSDLKVDGKPLIVSINAFYKPSS